MGIDPDWTYWSILAVVGIMVVMPFLTPLLTSIILCLVLRTDMVSAIGWGIVFGVLAVPFVWALSRHWDEWPGRLAGLAASIAWTTLFLWWWARRNRAVPGGHRPSAAK